MKPASEVEQTARTLRLSFLVAYSKLPYRRLDDETLGRYMSEEIAPMRANRNEFVSRLLGEGVMQDQEALH